MAGSAAALPRPPSSYPSSALPRRPPRRSWLSSPFLRSGLPFLAFLGLSTILLSSFLNDQYERQRRQQTWEGAESELESRVESRMHGREEGAPALKGTEQRERRKARKKKEFDLSEEYARMIGSLDLDSFENVRVPRPNEIAERTKTRRAQLQPQPTDVTATTSPPLPSTGR